eukprot:TRINITY_DN22248_c0_g1_i1.p1 TRINITY_DN22248_c0_g1~~TRINITY_DN22248_c0_g1_i1.p1  ORF type:complete len:329 (-),score=68.07 TRINITY_DN22248_c0_g1_i1:567-1553(-)
MGANVSHADAGTAQPAPPSPSGLQQILPGMEQKRPNVVEQVDWLKLPCPVKYEEIQREALSTLKPELFEGMRFDFTKPLNHNFSLCHSLYMGPIEMPTQGTQIVKIPQATYEFGANLIDSRQSMLIGRIIPDGRMTARAKHDLTDFLSVKVNAQLTSEPHFSQVLVDLDYKGSDFQSQLKLGNNAFYGFNYIQSVTPQLALGGEAFWLGQQRKSGLGFAARWNSEKAVATGQIASTGMVALTYVQRVSEKVALASDFSYNVNTQEATTAVGYDYILRQCRLRGRIDSTGTVAAYLEERLNVGLTFLLSAEIDHWKKDYKFGFGMCVGE